MLSCTSTLNLSGGTSLSDWEITLQLEQDSHPEPRAVPEDACQACQCWRREVFTQLPQRTPDSVGVKCSIVKSFLALL